MGKSTKQYRILMQAQSALLEKEVQAYLNDGWFCQGGVSISCEDGEDILAQAVVKGRSGD